ncbi:MAG: SET domain-containing protein-lysine N-methyltransferase [Bacteroidia bacterium]|nr:SET domain-containing protein-lysine N-methyltransferase [Bacteroidia bacterium]
MKKQNLARTVGTDWSKVVKIKKSQLPKAGNGLFTLKEFKRGDIVCEYEGEIVPWSECEKRAEKGHEGYVFFFSRNRCVDAYYTPWAFGRYANDARGIGRVAGLTNNAQYEVKIRNGEKRVFIVATRTIPAGSEVFVHYGDDYWRYLEKTRHLFLAQEREKRRAYELRKKQKSLNGRPKAGVAARQKKKVGAATS